MVKVYKSKKGKEEILRTYDILLRKWEIDYSEIDVDTRYGSTHIIMVGKTDNPPLVLFHGVGDDSAMMWMANVKVLSDKFSIYAVDTIGGPGKSVPNKNYKKGFEQCLWIDDFLSALDLGKVNIAGVSNGAYLTQLYGAKRPTKVLKLVCIAGGLSAGDKDPGLLDMMQKFKVFFPEALFPTKKNLVKMANKLSGASTNTFIEDEDVMNHWFALLKHFNNIAMGYHKIISLNKDEVSNIRDKVLFIIGDKDPIAYSGKSLKILKENDVEYVIIKDAGHVINHEFLDDVNEMMVDFILK